MDARYLAVYRIYGINSLPEDREAELLRVPALSARAFLTTQPDVHCLHMDRQTATGSAALRALVGGTDRQQFLEEAIRSLRERRGKEGVGIFLIIEAQSNFDPPDLTNRADRDDFIVCFDQGPAESFRAQLRSTVDAILTAITLAMPSNRSREIKKVGDIAYFLDSQSGKPIYTLAFRGSARATVSGGADVAWVKLAGGYSQQIASDKRMATVARLLVQSLETGSSNLRSFIAAWSALEVFTNVVFKDSYEEQWVSLLATGTPAAAKKYFQRLQDVMKDKYRLLDKFLVVASLLDEKAAEHDTGEFMRVKDVRDRFFHTMEIEESALPSQAIQALVQKYLRLHVERGTPVRP